MRHVSPSGFQTMTRSQLSTIVRSSLRRISLRHGLLVGVVALLSACYPIGNASVPIPTAFIAAPQPAHKLVVFLPGRGDDLAGLQKSGIAQIIQRDWPDADVELAGLTMAYYTDGQSTRRLHDEVLAPALKHGYREIWLAGTSLGGMGALTYDRDYPGEIDGMLLMAPYLAMAASRKRSSNRVDSRSGIRGRQKQ